MRICAIVPTYDNPRTVRGVVERIRSHDLDVIVVDDGSGPDGRAACEQLQADGLATPVHLAKNKGKGGACKTGFVTAPDLGYSHALQVDADGQHDLDQIPTFVRAAIEHPDALVLAYPVYDQTAPRARRIARGITDFWVALEVGGRNKIRDAMIGFRVYPLRWLENLGRIGDRMGFDIEVVVRLVRRGCPTVNLPIKVRYLEQAEGGVSHFRPLRDNVGFALMHSRLCTVGCMQWLGQKLWPFGRKQKATDAEPTNPQPPTETPSGGTAR